MNGGIKMPRIIKGYEFKERQRDSFEEYKSIKFYTGLYGKDNIKILSLTNQFGQLYTDIYVKSNKKQYVIKSKNGLYWNNEYGWGNLKGATRFSKEETEKFMYLPVDTKGWVKIK
jgi:hypothetical protein